MSNNHPVRTRGILLVLSAPSGAGKTTLCSELRSSGDFVYAVSCTTRPPRPTEIDGVDYHFLTEEQFQRQVDLGAFLEHALVHNHSYGTLKAPILSTLREGRDLLLDIDIVGAKTIRQCADPEIREALVDVFLLPPPISELRRRLESRGTESSEEISTRLHNALEELKNWPEYRYIIASGTVEENLRAFRCIVAAERSRSKRHIPS